METGCKDLATRQHKLSHTTTRTLSVRPNRFRTIASNPPIACQTFCSNWPTAASSITETPKTPGTALALQDADGMRDLVVPHTVRLELNVEGDSNEESNCAQGRGKNKTANKGTVSPAILNGRVESFVRPLLIITARNAFTRRKYEDHELTSN